MKAASSGQVAAALVVMAPTTIPTATIQNTLSASADAVGAPGN